MFENMVGKIFALVVFSVWSVVIICILWIYSVGTKTTKLGVLNPVLLTLGSFLNPFGSRLPLANIVVVFSMG